MRALAVINRRAGGFAEEKLRTIERALTLHRIYLDEPESSRIVDESLAESELVLSCGGDGTFNYLAERVLATNASALLAYCPFGTGNDLGRSIGIRSLDQLLSSIKKFNLKRIDVIRLLKVDRVRYVVNALDFGVGPEISRFLEEHRGLSWISIFIALPLKLLPASSFSVNVKCDGEYYRFRTIETIVGNGRYLGRGIKVAPHSYLNDGLMEIYVINPYSGPSAFMKLKTIYDGSFVKRGHAFFRSCRRAEILADRDTFEVDGELESGNNIVLEVYERKLGVLVGDHPEAVL
ncbi:MAG: diacylglycerol/lipid kinase family protein [Nitrososphaeria archaeon]